MKSFEYGWYDVEIRLATGKEILEVKAKNEENAIKQIKKFAKEHTEEVRRVRPDFETEIYWDTFKLDHKGYQRLWR